MAGEGGVSGDRGGDIDDLVRLSAAVALREPERLEGALAAARRSSSPGRIEEVLLQSYLFVGFPAALEALARWRALSPGAAAAVEGWAPAGWGERGAAVCRTVYGAAYGGLRENVAGLHPDLEAWMIHEGYGKVLGRPGLSLRDRELCIVALLIVLDAPRQLHSHLRGALHAGASEEIVGQTLELVLAETAAAPGDPSGRARRARETWDRVRRRRRARAAADDSTKER